MSLLNYYPNVANIVHNPFSTTEPWNIVLLKIGQTHNFINILDILTINTLSKDLNINLHVYLNVEFNEQNIIDEIKSDITFDINNNVKFTKLSPEYSNDSVKLSILKHFMDQNKNIILLDNGWGLIKNFFGNSKSVFALETTAVGKIIDKLDIESLVDANIIIVPHTETNKNFINISYNIASKLKISPNIVTNLSLTLTKNKLGIDFIPIDEKYKSYIFNIKNTSHVKNIEELSMITLPRNEIKLSTEYLNNYIYYPYMDLNLTPDLSNDVKITNIFNSRGHKYEMVIDNIFKTFTKRFVDPTEGIYLRKTNGNIIIPKILHHIWIDNNESTKYSNAWQKKLVEPWEYKLWTNDDIELFINNNIKWQKLYRRNNTHIFKMLIIYLSILETYGGVVINSYVLPLNDIPNDMLSHKFVIGFQNETSHGTTLSFQTLLSVKGMTDDIKIKHFDAAREPFEGINKFFIDVKTKKRNRNNVLSDGINPGLFNKLYSTLLSIDTNSNKNIDKIVAILMQDASVYIYPSYYFSPSSYLYPKQLLDLAIMIPFQKNNDQIKTNIIKTPLVRNFNVTPNAILSRLNENPRDRYQTNQKIL